MADPRTFTEGETYALVDEAVKRETAEANSKVAELEAQVASLGNEKDALELRVTAAEEKATKAEGDLAAYKEQVETEKANEAKRATRLAEVAAVAPKLEITEERSNRIVAMADESFEDYVTSLREVANAGLSDEEIKARDEALAAVKSGKGDLPRESAAFNGGKGSAPKTEAKSTVKSIFDARAKARAAYKSA